VVEQHESGPEPGLPLLAGRYRLGAVLGSGAMGVVRTAWDTRLQRPVAVKTLSPGAGADRCGAPDLRRRFVAEGRAAAKVSHPGLVTVLDSGEDHGRPFLVMELLGGATLAQVIDEGPMPPDAVRELARQLLGALAAIHRSGLVHRDVKPSNILQAGPGRWKLTDFGIAAPLSALDPSLTATGVVLGTPAYLAPERLAGARATPASDLFALGVVVREALTGQRASRGPWRTMPPGTPGDLVGVVGRATCFDPDERYGSAEEMAATLAPAASDVTVAGHFGPAEPAAAGGRIALSTAPDSSEEPAAPVGSWGAPVGAELPATAALASTGHLPPTAALASTGPLPPTAALASTGPLPPTAALPSEAGPCPEVLAPTVPSGGASPTGAAVAGAAVAGGAAGRRPHRRWRRVAWSLLGGVAALALGAGILGAALQQGHARVSPGSDRSGSGAESASSAPPSTAPSGQPSGAASGHTSTSTTAPAPAPASGKGQREQQKEKHQQGEHHAGKGQGGNNSSGPHNSGSNNDGPHNSGSSNSGSNNGNGGGDN